MECSPALMKAPKKKVLGAHFRCQHTPQGPMKVNKQHQRAPPPGSFHDRDWMGYKLLYLHSNHGRPPTASACGRALLNDTDHLMRPDDLDLTYNPFDDDGDKRNDELTDRGKQYFGSTSNGNSSAQTTPAVTRRRVSTSDSQAASGSVMRRRHKRSRSDLRVDLHEHEEPSPASGHPLKSAAMRTAEFLDGITRPYLSKLVQSSSINNDLFGVVESEPIRTLPRIQEPTTEVLVHEVCISLSQNFDVALSIVRRFLSAIP